MSIIPCNVCGKSVIAMQGGCLGHTKEESPMLRCEFCGLLDGECKCVVAPAKESEHSPECDCEQTSELVEATAERLSDLAMALTGGDPDLALSALALALGRSLAYYGVNDEGVETFVEAIEDERAEFAKELEARNAKKEQN